MQIKTYIIITMFLIVFIITYHANIFGKHKEFFDAKTGIIKPNNANIDNLDVKQLKTLVTEQNNIINKQTEVINKYIEKTEKNNNKFIENIIKPNEDIDNYFKNIREDNDKIIKNNQRHDESVDISEQYKNKIKIVKTYLEDPIMRGSNIYESEQYSKLLEIGNIIIDDKVNPPHASHWSKNINL